MFRKRTGEKGRGWLLSLRNLIKVFPIRVFPIHQLLGGVGGMGGGGVVGCKLYSPHSSNNREVLIVEFQAKLRLARVTL